MIIYVDNHSSLPRGEVRDALGAIDRQIQRDFSPTWGLSASLVLLRKGQSLQVPPDGKVAHIHLMDHGQAIGFHIEEQSGIAAGFVITDLPALTGSVAKWLTWTTALSHEVLELIADPFVNLLAKGPHPRFKGREVFHYREVCDPVQSLVYDLDGVSVSNFVLPHYYNAVGQRGMQNDFLNSRLRAFRWVGDGVIGFWDPKVGKNGRYVEFPQAPPKSAAHQARRAKGKHARLSRYTVPHLAHSRR